jgi:hypothetical protein
MKSANVDMRQVVIGLVVGAAAAATVGWNVHLNGLDEQITRKQSALKKLTLSGGIPPNDEVMSHLAQRQEALERSHAYWEQAVIAPPVPDEAKADPQLYFQEQVHTVQQTFEQLAVDKNVPVPEQLGLPKELPPADTVPRLLAQLSLSEELAQLILNQQSGQLTSLKIEDPEPVAPPSAEEPMPEQLVRLPVRVRMTTSLALAAKTLAAIHDVRPLIDIRSIRIAPASTGLQPGPAGGAPAAHPDLLDVELGVARYIMVASAVPPDTGKQKEKARGKGKSKKKQQPAEAGDAL